MIGDAGRDQPSDQVARNIAGDVGGEGRGRILRAVMLAEIGKGEGEGRGHAQALQDTQNRKCGEVWCVSEQRRRDREQHEADENAAPPVDAAREIADGEAGHEHAERARIGGETHLPRRHAVMLGQHGQDGLRGEEIDEAQERRERDDDGAEEHTGRVTMGLALGGGNRVTDVRHGLGSSIDVGGWT